MTRPATIPSVERIIDDDDGPVQQNCGECRYWSERIAQSVGCRPIEAMCFAKASRHHMKYTTARMVCDQWAVNSLGAVDSVWWEQHESDPFEAYASYDGGTDEFEFLDAEEEP
jgi:hypothetical protein